MRRLIRSTLCVFCFYLFCYVLRHFQQSFRHIATLSGYDNELKAHISSAASLKYQTRDLLIQQFLAQPKESKTEKYGKDASLRKMWKKNRKY